MKRLDFVYFDAGGGHRAAANALRMVIGEQGRPWEVNLVHLQDVLDPLDVFRKLTGLRLQDIYNLMLERGWTLGSPQLTRLMHIPIRLYHRPSVALLETLWRQRRPDLVVSLVPNFNRALGESVRRALPGAPFVTVLTDLADYPPHFWFERQEQFLVCGSPRAAQQARAMGHAPERVFETSGMMLHPRFYQPVTVDRAAERERLGLHPECPTGLILYGGHGSSKVLRIFDRLESAGPDLQLIILCGHNQELRRALEAKKGRLAKHVVGFTDEVPYYMRLSDFFIGKPGPASISEALTMKLPVIVERNAWTLPQERYNADWVVENGVGLVVHSFDRIERAVRQLLDPAAFARMRANAAGMRIRAVYEVPEILERLLNRPNSAGLPE